MYKSRFAKNNSTLKIKNCFLPIDFSSESAGVIQ